MSKLTALFVWAVLIANRRMFNRPVDASGSPIHLHTDVRHLNYESEAFDRHYREVHGPLANQLPRLNRYTFSKNTTLMRT